MPTIKDQRRRDLAKIHIAAKQLGLSDDTYRAMLLAVAGVRSAADLTEKGRRAVLAHLRKAGFTSRKKYPGRPDIDSLAATGRKALLEKIEAFLADAKRDWDYVHAIAKRMFDIDRVQWCRPDQLHKIVAALEYDARRRKKRLQHPKGKKNER